MKRVGLLIDWITDLDNLYLAFKKASRGKQKKREVIMFAESLDNNMQRMRQEIESGEISIGNYRYFTIYDPKKRIICAASFYERVMQHAIMNICHPYFDRTLIDTVYANRKGKGLYAALNKAVEAMSSYKYTVKMDVRKFYDTIDHNVLKSKLKRIFKDKTLLLLFGRIIDSYCVTSGKGLPMGNLASQYFANTYLSELDHKVKEEWKASIYIRYMDDILIAGNSKETLKQCVNYMQRLAERDLLISFKPPIFRKNIEGQTFLGYKVMPFHCKLSGRSKKRFRKKLLLYNRLKEKWKWNDNQYVEHILPLLSFAQHADSEKFRRACLAIK